MEDIVAHPLISCWQTRNHNHNHTLHSTLLYSIQLSFIQLSFIQLYSIQLSFIKLSFIQLSFIKVSFIQLSFIQFSFYSQILFLWPLHCTLLSPNLRRSSTHAPLDSVFILNRFCHPVIDRAHSFLRPESHELLHCAWNQERKKERKKDTEKENEKKK